MTKKLFYPLDKLSKEAHVKSLDHYNNEYNQSIQDQNQFWEEKAERSNWYKKWESIGSFDYSNGRRVFHNLSLDFHPKEIQVIGY